MIEDLKKICPEEIPLVEPPKEIMDPVKSEEKLPFFQRSSTIVSPKLKPRKTFDLDPCPNCQCLTVLANYCMHCGFAFNNQKRIAKTTSYSNSSTCIHCSVPITMGLVCANCNTKKN